MKKVLGKYHAHTENSGWTIQVIQDNDFVMVETSILGHCATSSVNLILAGKKPGDGLTSEDLHDISTMFALAASRISKE